MMKKLLIFGLIGLLIYLTLFEPVTSDILFSRRSLAGKIIALSKHLIVTLFRFAWALMQTLFAWGGDLWRVFSGYDAPTYDIHDSYELYRLYQQVSAWSGLPWQIFWGIHAEETALGHNLGNTPILSVLPKQQKPYFLQMCRELRWDPQQVHGSHKGAIAQFQFIPETWVRHAIDANGDGRKDPFDVEDAAYSAAHYLLYKGAQRDLRKAIWHYNQDERYVQRVMRYLKYS